MEKQTLVKELDVTEGFRSAGAVDGDLIFFHASFKSMGLVEGGPLTVINGALAAAGGNGTVAMPSLWYNGKEGRNNPADYNPRTSSSYVGALSETLRTDPRSYTSNNFSHSVSAIGTRAVELTDAHDKCEDSFSPWSPNAFSKNSPWDRLYHWDALYCFIGTDMNVCTLKHYIEAGFIEECLNKAASDKYDRLRMRVSRFRVPGVWPYLNSSIVQEFLEGRGLIRTGRIGSAVIKGIRSRVMVEETRNLLRIDQGKLLSKEFMDWRNECEDINCQGERLNRYEN